MGVMEKEGSEQGYQVMHVRRTYHSSIGDTPPSDSRTPPYDDNDCMLSSSIAPLSHYTSDMRLCSSLMAERVVTMFKKSYVECPAKEPTKEKECLAGWV